MVTVSDNSSETYQKREKILSKYRFIGMGQNLEILNEFIVGRIIHYLNSGFFDTEYMQHFFDIDDADIKSWEHLYNYWRLSNYEYKKYCDETITYYSENKCENLKELFVIISVLSVLSHIQLLSVSEEEIINVGKRNIDRLMENIHEMEDLDKSNKMVHLGLRSHSNLKEKELQNKLYKYFYHYKRRYLKIREDESYKKYSNVWAILFLILPFIILIVLLFMADKFYMPY